MSQLTAQHAEAITTACREASSEIAAGLSRTFEQPFEVSVGELAPLQLKALPTGCQWPGLLVTGQVGTQGVALLLSEATGLLPGWYAEPDVTGRSKLDTLAQELTTLTLPSDVTADRPTARRVARLDEALAAGQPAADAQVLSLNLTADGKSTSLYLVWPLANIDAMYPAAAPQAETTSQSATPAAGTVGANVAATPGAIDYSDLSQVPPYTKNLLRIRLPVQVTLASKRQPISRILDLGPGVIIQFSKSCEEMLALEVAGQPIAEGEPVKVGDKFGLRITSVTVPKEHFKAIGKKRTG